MLISELRKIYYCPLLLFLSWYDLQLWDKFKQRPILNYMPFSAFFLTKKLPIWSAWIGDRHTEQHTHIHSHIITDDISSRRRKVAWVFPRYLFVLSPQCLLETHWRRWGSPLFSSNDILFAAKDSKEKICGMWGLIPVRNIGIHSNSADRGTD